MTNLAHITTEIDTAVATMAHTLASNGYVDSLMGIWSEGDQVELGSQAELNLRRSVETLHKLANDLGWLHGGLVQDRPALKVAGGEQ